MTYIYIYIKWRIKMGMRATRAWNKVGRNLSGRNSERKEKVNKWIKNGLGGGMSGGS